MPVTAPLRIIRPRDTGPGLPRAAQARVAEGARARVAELPAAQGHDARPQAQHRLRGGALPEHRRVLAPRHGDVHDPRRRLHARVRLLRRAARQAGRTRPGRAARASPKPSPRWGCKYVVITSVDRDDLADGGASIFAETIREIRARTDSCRIEVLIPDFQGLDAPLRAVLDAAPDVLNHNTETVPRLYRIARAAGATHAALELLDRARRYAPGIPTKTGLMVGLGEDRGRARLQALRGPARTSASPSSRSASTCGRRESHLPMVRYYTPEEFARAEAHRARHGLRPRGVRSARAQLVSRARTGGRVGGAKLTYELLRGSGCRVPGSGLGSWVPGPVGSGFRVGSRRWMRTSLAHHAAITLRTWLAEPRPKQPSATPGASLEPGTEPGTNLEP